MAFNFSNWHHWMCYGGGGASLDEQEMALLQHYCDQMEANYCPEVKQFLERYIDFDILTDQIYKEDPEWFRVANACGPRYHEVDAGEAWASIKDDKILDKVDTFFQVMKRFNALLNTAWADA
jgi:hypothetical protein